MRDLPESVLRAHVWPRVHQLRLRRSLQAIQRAGPSFFEDMPDLSHGDDFDNFDAAWDAPRTADSMMMRRKTKNK